MNTLNQSKTQAIGQPTLLSSVMPKLSCTESLRASITGILVATGLAAALAAPAWAYDSESVAHDNWRAFMGHNSAREEGCFHASYPNTLWERVDCKVGQPIVNRGHVTRPGVPEVPGTSDYAAKAQGLITWSGGSFSDVTGVTSEIGVGLVTNSKGVLQGILGPNEYSVQLNTNIWETTSACAGHSGCHVWQQFLYATDYYVHGEAAVFMQYWLMDWGSSACPSGWTKDDLTGVDCSMNSAYMDAPDVPPTDLGQVALTASAEPGGLDTVSFVYGDDVIAVSAKDSVLDISSVWNKTEFNVLGNGGGSSAVFNPGASITVTVALDAASGTVPTCVANGGTSGESNNFSILGPCSANDLFFPAIVYTESGSN